MSVCELKGWCSTVKCCREMMDGTENARALWKAAVSFTGLCPQGMGEVISDGRKSNGGQFFQPLGKWEREKERERIRWDCRCSDDLCGHGTGMGRNDRFKDRPAVWLTQWWAWAKSVRDNVSGIRGPEKRIGSTKGDWRKEKARDTERKSDK